MSEDNGNYEAIEELITYTMDKYSMNDLQAIEELGFQDLYCEEYMK